MGRAGPAAREQGYIYGTANLHRDSRLTVRVRARFDPGGWSTWSEPVNLHCFETENPATSQQQAGSDQQAETGNSPATSAPTIGGSAQVGETLTADTSGIADEDGLTNATFSFQWVAGGSDISGATGSTYTLTASDQGQTVQVRVSFTDDAGNEETLTSEATAAVAAAPAPLTVSLTVAAPTTHDGSSSFTFEIRFSEEPESDFSYKTLRNHAFTVTGGTVRNAERMDRPSNMRWLITVEPDSNGDVTIVLPITEDCGAQGAICTAEGEMLTNSLNFTVSGPGG